MYVLRIVLFLAIVLVVVVGGHVYLYRRLFRDTTRDRRTRPLRALAVTVAGASPLRGCSSPVRAPPGSTPRGAMRWASPPGAGWAWGSTSGCRWPSSISG